MSWTQAMQIATDAARLTGCRYEVRAKFWPWVGTPNGWAYYVRPTGKRVKP